MIEGFHLHAGLLESLPCNAGCCDRHKDIILSPLLVDDWLQLVATGIRVASCANNGQIRLLLGQSHHTIGGLNALEFRTSVAGVGSLVQRLAFGELVVVLGAQADLPDGTAITLDHILVAGTLQIDLGIDGSILAVVHGIRLDEQMGGGVLVLRLQSIGEEALQTRLQLVQLLRVVNGLLVGDVAAPGALGPGAGGSGDRAPGAILAQIFEILRIALRWRRIWAGTRQTKVLFDVLHLGEGHLALTLVQAAYGAIIATELVRIVALLRLLAQSAQIGVLLLQQAIRFRMRGVGAHQARLREELGQRLQFALRSGDLRIGGHLQDVRVLQLGDGDLVADVAAEASVAGLGATQLLQGANGGVLLHQDNALVTEGGCREMKPVGDL